MHNAFGSYIHIYIHMGRRIGGDALDVFLYIQSLLREQLDMLGKSVLVGSDDSDGPPSVVDSSDDDNARCKGAVLTLSSLGTIGPW